MCFYLWFLFVITITCTASHLKQCLHLNQCKFPMSSNMDMLRYPQTYISDKQLLNKLVASKIKTMHCLASMLLFMGFSPTHLLMNVFYLIRIPASTPTWNNTTFYSDFSKLPSQAQLQQDWNQSYSQQDGHKKHCCFFVPGSQLAPVLLTCCHKDLKPLQVPILIPLGQVALKTLIVYQQWDQLNCHGKM